MVDNIDWMYFRILFHKDQFEQIIIYFLGNFNNKSLIGNLQDDSEKAPYREFQKLASLQ